MQEGMIRPMKKIVTTLVAALLIGAMLTACGGTEDASTSTDDGVASRSQTESNTEQNTDEKSKLSALTGVPLTDAMDKFDELGYAATYYADGVDFTEFIDDLKEDYTTGELEINESEKTVKVELVLTSNLEAEKLEDTLAEKLELGSAWNAATKYGENQYGSTFELHYLTGKIEEAADDKDTWFLKAECSINGESKTCEAKVTGTTDKPEVVFFDIY